MNVSGSPITLLGPFEKDPARWVTMPYINIHDGSTHTLSPPTLLALLGRRIDRGRIKLENEIHDVGPMDAIRVAPALARAFEAGPDGLELLVFGPRYETDGEVLRDKFWPEEADK